MFETLLLRMEEAKRTGIFGEVDRSKFSETQKILFEFFPLSKSTNSEIQVPQKLINQFQILVQVYVPQNIRKIYFLHKISKTRF